MDLPAPPSGSPAPSRAPASGSKLMFGILILFALLAAYGQWQHLRRPETIRATIKRVPNESITPTPEKPVGR
jgi:hypothetical protein